jgi:predicted signal transduction protein with EAL and GGDEF domain
MGLAARQVGLIARSFRVAEHDCRSLPASAAVSGQWPDAHELLMNADAAMYHAKGIGKNGYSFFDASMNSNARKQLQLLQDLRNALEQQDSALYYQPKFDAGTRSAGRCRGVAALAASDARHVAAGQVHRLAEKTGLIIPIGDWVLNEACRQMRLWYVQGYTDWRIAVNLSAVQFCHVGLVRAWPWRWPRTSCRPTA